MGFTRSKPAEEDYQEIIQEHARDGWRFVQIVAPTFGSSGQPEYFDLIFERKYDYNTKEQASQLALLLMTTVSHQSELVSLNI